MSYLVAKEIAANRKKDKATRSKLKRQREESSQAGPEEKKLKTRCTAKIHTLEERIRSETYDGRVVPVGMESAAGKILIQHTCWPPASSDNVPSVPTRSVFLVPTRQFIKDVAPVAFAFDPDYTDTISWMMHASWVVRPTQGPADQAQSSRVEALFHKWDEAGYKRTHRHTFFDNPTTVLMRESLP